MRLDKMWIDQMLRTLAFLAAMTAMTLGASAQNAPSGNHIENVKLFGTRNWWVVPVDDLTATERCNAANFRAKICSGGWARAQKITLHFSSWAGAVPFSHVYSERAAASAWTWL